MASKFWVGGGTNTNWNSSPTTNWANTSGGAGNQTAPATGDDVTFDNSSGTGASVWNTSISLNSLKCSASRNLVSHSSAITLTISGGDLELPGGVGATYTPISITSLFQLTGTTGTQKITSSGKNLFALTLNGVGGTFQLQDNLNCSAGVNAIVTLTNGTFDAQGFNITTGLFVSSAANTRTLIATGTITVGSVNTTGSIFSLVATSLTSTGFTPKVTVTGTTNATRTLAFGGLATYSDVSIGANTGGANTAITGANTFATLAITAPNYIQLPAATTTTVTTAPTISGSSGSEIAIVSNNPASNATLSVATGTVAFSWAAFQAITGAGGATFTATSSFDLGRNSNVTITAPASGPVGHQCM